MIARKQLEVHDVSPIPPHTQHHFLLMQIRFADRFLWFNQIAPRLLTSDVLTHQQFFVSRDHPSETSLQRVPFQQGFTKHVVQNVFSVSSWGIQTSPFFVISSHFNRCTTVVWAMLKSSTISCVVRCRPTLIAVKIWSLSVVNGRPERVASVRFISPERKRTLASVSAYGRIPVNAIYLTLCVHHFYSFPEENWQNVPKMYLLILYFQRIVRTQNTSKHNKVSSEISGVV